MNFNEMNQYVSIYHHKSIKKAAESEYISPQAMSKTLLKIEKELMTTLFIRTRDGLIPTKDGEKVYRHVYKIIGDYNLMNTDLTLSQNEGQKTIRLPSTYAALTHLSINFVHDFYQEFPEMHLDMFETPDQPLYSYIDSEEVPMALVTMPYNGILYEGHHLFTQRHCLVLRRDHPLAKYDKLSLQQLDGIPLAIKGREFSIFNGNMSKFIAHGVIPKIYLETSEEDLIHEFALTGEGIGVSLKDSAERALDPRLKICYFEDDTWIRRVAIIKKKDSVLDADDEAFYDYIVTWCRKNYPRNLEDIKL